MLVVKVGMIFQKCDPLLHDALEGLVIFPVSRNPLTIHGEARQSRPRAAPLERALAVVVFAVVALCAHGHPGDAQSVTHDVGRARDMSLESTNLPDREPERSRTAACSASPAAAAALGSA